jgi:CheY-like chemotaxis protein
MAHRTFVKVVGFSAAERHALNTVFRLSEERHAPYTLWQPDSPEAPGLLLLDGDSAESRTELEQPYAAGARLIWVGGHEPPRTWRVFERPISWPHVIHAIDRLFGSVPASQGPDSDVDFDLGGETDAMDTQPPDTLPPEPVAPLPRALVASADREQRLYLRARLALAGLTMVDEADSDGQAVELARRITYRIAIIEHRAPNVDAWFVLRRLQAIGADRPAVILVKAHATLLDRVHAWLARAAAFLPTPPDPVDLDAAIRRVVATSEPAAPVLAVQPH